jgi:hypothetical protein
MRFSVPAALLLFMSVTIIPGRASNDSDDKTIDQRTIDALTIKASQAQPHEQCFLYAELVHQMTELSLRQYAAADVEKASGLLRQIQLLTHKIHISVSNDDKRLKNTEILLRRTAFRLSQMLHSSSSDDRQLVQETLSQVNQAETEAMMQVFRK